MGDYCHICLRVFSDDLKESTLCDENTPIGENKSNGKTNRAGRVMRADEQLEEMCEKIKCVNCNRYVGQQILQEKSKLPIDGSAFFPVFLMRSKSSLPIALIVTSQNKNFYNFFYFVYFFLFSKK